jgi:hypothetical protein
MPPIVPQTQNNAGFGTWLSSHGYNDPNVVSAAVANPNTQASAYQNYLKESGSGGNGFSSPNAPTVNLQSVYDNALNGANVQGLQAEADAVQKQIDDRRVALTDATGKINDNPFYSEATRVGRVAKLNDVANSDINNFTNQLGIATGKVSSAKADAQVKLNIATQQYNIDDQAYQQSVNMFNQLLTSGALNGVSSDDIGQISVATGLPISVVHSIIETSKSSQNKPSLMTVDDGINQQVVAVSSDGTILSKNILGPSVAKTTGGGGAADTKATEKQAASDMLTEIYTTFQKLVGPQGFVSKEDWAKMKAAAVSAGMSPATFDKEFASFKNPSAKDHGYVYN